RSHSSGRKDVCVGGGADGGGAATALPAAAAARPAGGRSSLHLAYAADQGGGGGRREHAADRGAAVVGLATPGLVSPGGRTLAWVRPDTRSPSLRLTRVTSRRGGSPVGGKGWCASMPGKAESPWLTCRDSLCLAVLRRGR